MERFLGISAKIEEKSIANIVRRPAPSQRQGGDLESSDRNIYPLGRVWLNQKDQSRVDKIKSEFEEKHMSSLYQSHLFEKMCNGDMRGAIALAE